MNMTQTDQTATFPANEHERAVLYARVSSDDRSKEGRNLKSQLDMGREYAQGRGYTIITESMSLS